MRIQRVRTSNDEGGFTIIELVAALGILSIVAASLAGVFWSAIRTAGNAAHRSDGASIASREIESIRSFRYADIGLYADQTGYAATFTDPDTGQVLNTVTLGPTTPTGAPSNIQPVTPDPNAATTYDPDPDPNNALAIVQGGVTYTVHRYVGWMDTKDASNTYTEAYKRTVVTVTWTDQAGTHNIHQSSIVYPGGEGKYNGPQGAGLTTTTPTTILTTPGQPTLNPITVPGPGSLALSWTAPSSGAAVTSYSIEYSTDPSFPAVNFTSIGNPTTNTLAPNILTYTLTGLADSTLYYVEIIAYAGTNPGTPSASQSATTQNPPALCTLGSLSVAGATTKSTSGTFLAKTGRMTENLTLSWSTSGSGATSNGQHQCTNTFQVVAANSGGGADPNSPYTISATTPGNYSGTIISKNLKGWATGVHTFTIWDVTAGSSTFVVKTFKICAAGVPTC